jgi:hypothetical protein
MPTQPAASPAPNNGLPAQLHRGDWIDFTRTNGSAAAGYVAYDRNGVIKYRAQVGQGPRWINRADIAEATVIPNPA